MAASPSGYSGHYDGTGDPSATACGLRTDTDYIFSTDYIITKEYYYILAEKLKIIPLGGLNEIGKNMTVLEYGKDMIVVDCGLGFPEDDMYGVDLVIPDVTYLVNNEKKLRGIPYVITLDSDTLLYPGSSASLLRFAIRTRVNRTAEVITMPLNSMIWLSSPVFGGSSPAGSCLFVILNSSIVVS